MHGSRASSVPLQNVANEEQPEQDIFQLLKPVEVSSPIPQPPAPILTHLPLPQTSQPERVSFTPDDPQHSSGSRFLSFSLQKAARKQGPDSEQSSVQPPILEASSSVLQPIAVPPFIHLSSVKASQTEFFSNDVMPKQDLICSLHALSSNATQSVVKPQLDPPIYAQFNVQGTLDVPGTLLAIAKRFEKLENWTIGQVCALKERMKDVERRLAYKEKEKEGAASKKGIMPNPGPQLAAAQIRATPGPEFDSNDISLRQSTFSPGPFATESSESPQQNIGLNLSAAGQDSFYLRPISPPQPTRGLLFNLVPDPFPPAESLLFLPPNPPPIVFDPFSPEEDIVPVPPAPEPRNYQLSPVRCITLRSPLLSLTRSTVQSPVSVHGLDQNFQDHTVPYPPLPSTQSFTVLSPLSIALLSPWPFATPSPNELDIKIAGPEGYLNADNYKHHVTHFLLSRANEVANSLVVVWQLSHVDSGGARGMMSLRALFAQLDEKVLDSDRTALSSFRKISITIPDLVKDIAPYNDLMKPIKEDDGINLANAMDLVEFVWYGDFAIFACKFKNLSFATLTVLNLKSSDISIEDAVTLLHSCPDLEEASLGTIQHEEDCEAVLPFQSTGVQRKALPKLTHLALDSNVALDPLIRRIRWTAQISLNLTLRNQGKTNIHDLPLRWQSVFAIELNCHLTSQELINVQKVFPSVKYHDIGV